MSVDTRELPFEDRSFLGDVIQAVLQYVRGPVRVSKDAAWVLRVNGILFAHAVFLQQVHLVILDYCRFTLRAHSRSVTVLNAHNSVVALQPATVPVWSTRYLVRAATVTVLGRASGAHSRCCLSSLSAFGVDKLLARNTRASEGASKTYHILS